MELIEELFFLEDNTAFHRSLDLSLIRRNRIRDGHIRAIWRELCDDVVDLGGDPQLVSALDECLSQRYWRSPSGRARLGAQRLARMSRRIRRRARRALRL